MHPVNHAQGRMEYLVELIEESIRHGHRFKAVRYYFMIKSCGMEIGENPADLCQALCLAMDSKLLHRAQDQAQRWARMISAGSCTRFSVSQRSDSQGYVVLQADGRSERVKDKHHDLHEAFRPLEQPVT